MPDQNSFTQMIKTEMERAFFEIAHFAEEFWTVDDAVAHFHVVGVPNGRAGARCEIAIGDDTSIYMPERVFPLEMAVVGLDVTAFLHARLTVGYGDILHAEVVRLK